MLSALMGYACVVIALAEGAPPAAPTAMPSVALLPLDAKVGVDAPTADVITESLVVKVREQGMFSRVVSAKDLETVMGLEAKRQAVNCSTDSCMADIAGALGVDFVMAGSVARLGGSFVFNIKLVNARTGLAASSVAMRLRGDSSEVLLDAIGPSVMQLLRDAHLRPPSAQVPEPEQLAAPSKSAAASAAPLSKTPLPGNRAWWIAGAGALSASAILTVGGFVAGAVALSTQVLPRILALPWPANLTYNNRFLIMNTGSGAALAIGALAWLLAVASLASGAGTLVFAARG
jgi:TolB-like protein